MSETRKGIYLIVLSYVIMVVSAFVLIFKLFYPRHVVVAVVVYLSNWVVFFIGVNKLNKRYLKKFKQYRKIFMFTVLVFVIVYVIYLLVPIGKVEFLGMEKSELRDRLDSDYTLMKVYINGLEGTMRKIDEKRAVFGATSLDDLSEDEIREILELWADYVDYQVALNKLVDDYKYFYQISYFLNRDMHARAFLIGYASFLASYDNGLRLIDYTFGNELFESLLDDFSADYGIAPGAYTELKNRVIHFDDVTRLTAGYGNYLFLYPEYEWLGLTESDAGVFEYIEGAYEFSTEKLIDESVVWFPVNGVETFRDKTYDVYFPVQKGVATQMGNTRVTSRHENFITKGQLDEMRGFMEPGDIMVQRRNWYTSNIGIPGFWPHAAIYLGTRTEFVNYFNTLEVNAYVVSNGFGSIEEMLEDEVEFYDVYSGGSVDVIEAIGEGVVLQTLYDSALSDYVGVVRPRLDKLSKFKAMVKAISYYGRPYDYHFDFVTDSEIVCSELVYKAYRSYLNITLEQHAGRSMYTATNMIRKFDAEYDSDVSEFEFVYFLEGSEENGNAVVSDLETFRETATRVKWDVSQE